MSNLYVLYKHHAHCYTYAMGLLLQNIYLELKDTLKLGRASLVAQWLRVCLPMQGTRVRALVWEDPTCRGAAGPVSHNY